MRPPDAAALVTHFRSGGAARAELVGRQRELAALMAGLDAAERREGRSSVVGGEPGIGKTRLAEALADAARERGARVAWGRCWEAGGAPAHWPWVQVVRELLDGLDRQQLTAALGADAAGVAALAPELQPRLGLPTTAVEGDGARFAAWDATASFLARLASERPLVVVLDDIHAADVPSLLLLRFVARSLRERRLLVVATVRDSDARARPGVAELVAEIGREGDRIALSGLGEADIATLVAAYAGRRPPPRFARELRRATDGNPLWVEEVIRMRLADSAGDPFALPCPVPAGIGATLDSHVAALTPRARELLAVAAVAGRDWSAARVADLTGAAPEDVTAAVASATAAGLLLPHAGGYGHHRFAHALVRDALYESLPLERRQAIHRALAESLEADAPDELAQLAHHYAAAGDGAAERAYRYARAAGDAAASALAFEDAAEHYERAIAIGMASAETECDLLLALGDARVRAGDTDSGRTAFARAASAARALGAPQRLAAAALGYGSAGELWANGQVDSGLVALLEEALRALPDEPTALRALVLARLADALLYAHDWVRTGELSTAAVDTARAAGDDVALVRALAARLLALMRPPTLDERVALTDELWDAAARTRSAERELDALTWRVTLALEQGDRAAVDAYVARFTAIAEEQRQPHMLWGARIHASMRALLSGRLDDAERLAHEAIAVAEGIVPLAGPMFAVQILGIRREQGRLAEVEPGLRAFVEAYPAVRAWRTTWAAILIETGAEQEGRAELERIARDDFLIEPDDYEWAGAMTVLGEAFAGLRDRERCTLLYERLLPYADLAIVVSIGVSCAGPVARHLALMAEALGDGDAAARHFEDALALCERLGARAYGARTRFEHGRMLVNLGDVDAGRELLRAAAEQAESMGMALADEARALLAEHSRPAGPAELVFSRTGDVWEIGDGLAPVRLNDAKGLRYLAALLAQPRVDVAAAELAGALGPLGDAGPAIDSDAKAAYRRRVDDLRSEVDDAERWNDPERGARARAELDAITTELAGAVGLGGRDRRAASTRERARVSVTKAIRTTIRRIAEHDADLGDHLSRAVKTGAFCRYDSPAREQINWRL